MKEHWEIDRDALWVLESLLMTDADARLINTIKRYLQVHGKRYVRALIMRDMALPGWEYEMEKFK